MAQGDSKKLLDALWALNKKDAEVLRLELSLTGNALRQTTISPSTSGALSDKHLYGYFMRTIPPDTEQARVMSQYLDFFDLRMLAVIYSAEPYGEGIYNGVRMVSPLQLRGIAFPLTPEFDDASANRIVQLAVGFGSRFILIDSSSWLGCFMILFFVFVGWMLWKHWLGKNRKKKKKDQGKTIMQLYSIERKQQQLLEGYAGTVGNVLVADGEGPFAFCERKQGKLHIMDVSKARGEGMPAPFKIFAVALHLSEHGIAYMITKNGCFFMFDVATAMTLVRTRVLQDTVFISTVSPRNGGCIFVNRKGVALSAQVESAIVNCINNNLVHIASRQEIAFNLAKRFELPGADELFNRQFNHFFAAGDYKSAGTRRGPV